VTTLQDCPECALPVEVTPRGRLTATDGGLEHVFVRCVVGHWFLGPLVRLFGDANEPPAGG
jgi:hypothetical protein